MQSSLLNLAAGWGLDEEMWLSGFLGFQTSLSRQLCPCSVLSVAPELFGFSLGASGFLARVLGPQNEWGWGVGDMVQSAALCGAQDPIRGLVVPRALVLLHL